MRRFSVLFGCIITGTVAEVFELKDTAIPQNMSLEARYIFHVNVPVGPQATGGASVTFKGFEIQWSDGKVGIGDYKTLQVSLIPKGKFFKLVENSMFCSGDREFLVKDVGVASVFNVAQKQDATFPITETGSYFLSISNCGESSGATFTNGQVIVKQPHGYLPANKTATLSWMGWFALINAFLCVMWGIAAARHYKKLVHVQKMIAACAIMALLEAVFAYVQYAAWNNTGNDGVILQSLSMFAYSLKYVVTLRMLMETAAGSGVVVEKLEVQAELKTDVICSLFLITQWIWKALVAYKYRVLITPSFLLVATIPGTMLWLCLFVWVYKQFRNLSSQILEKKLASEAATLFINLRMVLVGSMLLAFVVLLVQVTDIMVSETPWNLQWVPYDAAPHSVYTLFLLSLMILWWPNVDSWKLGYFNQLDQDEAEKVDGKDQAEDGKVNAEQIGAPEAEEL